MKNNSLFDIQNDLFHSFSFSPHKEYHESADFKEMIVAQEQNGPFKSSLLIELIQRVDHSMESIKNMMRISRGKFRDKIFDDHFHHVVREEIGKVDLLLSSVLNYLKVNAIEKKVNTVHTIIEKTLKENQALMEGEKVRVLKKFEKDLPEIIVLDEHLKYILDSTLKYAMRLMPPNGFVGFMTRSFIQTNGPAGANAVSIGDGKYVEISVLFDSYRKTGEPFDPASQDPPPAKKETRDFELRLIEEMVKKNQGAMEFGTDPKKGRTLILLRFPVERRKVLYFPSIN